MRVKSALSLGLLNLSLLAVCSCGNSTDFDSVVTEPTGMNSSLEVVNRFSLPGPSDEITAQASTNASGHVLYTVLQKDFEGDTVNYEGLVILDRPNRTRRTLTFHSIQQATVDQLIEYSHPQVDHSGEYASWQESSNGQTKIGFLTENGNVAYWNPPEGTQFVKNLGVENQARLRLYAVVESGGVQALLRYVPATGETAEYILPNIVSGTLDLVLDSTCRYALGLASDGATTQLIYLVNNARPSVQVLTTESVNTYAVNSVGDASYTTTEGDLTYLRPEQLRAQAGGSIASVNQKVLGDAPPVAMGNLYGLTAQELSEAAHNANVEQQEQYIQAQANTTAGVSTLYSQDLAGTGVPSPSLYFVTPQRSISNASRLLPTGFQLKALDVEGETAIMVVSREQTGQSDLQILRGRIPQ